MFGLERIVNGIRHLRTRAGAAVEVSTPWLYNDVVVLHWDEVGMADRDADACVTTDRMGDQRSRRVRWLDSERGAWV